MGRGIRTLKMPQTPGCCDTEWELLRKMLLEFIELATSPVPDSLYPIPSDSPYNLWRKILLTLPYI